MAGYFHRTGLSRSDVDDGIYPSDRDAGLCAARCVYPVCLSTPLVAMVAAGNRGVGFITATDTNSAWNRDLTVGCLILDCRSQQRLFIFPVLHRSVSYSTD